MNTSMTCSYSAHLSGRIKHVTTGLQLSLVHTRGQCSSLTLGRIRSPKDYNNSGYECDFFSHILMNNAIFRKNMRYARKSHMKNYHWVNVLKIQTLVACQKSLDKQSRPRSDCKKQSDQDLPC